MEADRFDSLGALLAYTDSGWRQRAADCRARLASSHEQAAASLDGFLQAVAGLSLEELHELYTRTFDLNPVAALEVGWHLYGESYERGRFLVRTRQMLRETGVPESTELPDHLTCLLPALGRLEPEMAGPFAASYVLPALQRMREALAGKDNPYEKALAAVDRIVDEAAQGFPRELNGRPVPAGGSREDAS